MRQITFQKTAWNHRFSHGGSLRAKRKGRRERPLSTREPIHLVFKANRLRLVGGFRTHRRFALANAILRKYSARFFVKIQQVSFQGDHIHLAVRISRRSSFQNFLRVFSGQVAQRFRQEGLVTSAPGTSERARGEPGGAAGASGDVTDTPKLWKYRPFTRVVRGRRAHLTLRNYIQLNEQEAAGVIPYRKDRLRGLSPDEWRKLWS